MGQKKTAVVDGSNIAFAERTQAGDPRVANLVAVRRALESEGFDVITIVDASLRHRVDDPDQLEGLLDKQVVRQAPAGTDADYFVLKTAEEYDAYIVSNDRYEAFTDEFAWIEGRRMPLMIIGGRVELYASQPE